MDNNANMASRYEHEIPEGYEARIEGNKVIIELKESEDERIGKAIFQALSKKDARDVLLANGIQVSDALAWLEKQGQEKTTWVKEDEIGFIDAMWAIEQARTIAKDENDMGNLWYAEKWLNSLKDRVQPHSAWKPTEEQMEAIKQAAEQNRASEIGNILDNLLVEIKNM